MPLLHSHPPTLHHARVPATPAAALAHLQSYLAAAQSQPALHPTAELTPEGPTFSPYSAAAGAATRLLERAARGLAGEYVAAEAADGRRGRKDKAVEERRAELDGCSAEERRGAVEDLGAEDPQVYAEAQEYATAVNSEVGEEGEEGEGVESEEVESEEDLDLDEEERRARREEMKYARIHGDADGLDGVNGETVVEYSQEVIPDSQPIEKAVKERRRVAKVNGDSPKQKSTSKKRGAESQDLTPSKSVKWKLTKEETANKGRARYWDNRIKNWANAVPQSDSQ